MTQVAINNNVNYNLTQTTSVNGNVAAQNTGSWWNSLITFGKEALAKIESDVKAVVEKGIELTKEAPGVIAGIEKEGAQLGTEIESELGQINGVLNNALTFLQNNEFLAQILGPKFEASLQNILKEGITLTDKAETDVDDAVKALPGFAAELDNGFAEINQFLSKLDQDL